MSASMITNNKRIIRQLSYLITQDILVARIFFREGNSKEKYFHYFDLILPCWSMVFISDGFSFLLCGHVEKIRYFDLLKAFGYIERAIKSDFFSEKDLVYIIRAQRKISNHLI